MVDWQQQQVEVYRRQQRQLVLIKTCLGKMYWTRIGLAVAAGACVPDFTAVDATSCLSLVGAPLLARKAATRMGSCQ